MVETEIMQDTAYVSSYQVSWGTTFDDVLILRVESLHILLSVYLLTSSSPHFNCIFLHGCILSIFCIYVYVFTEGLVIRNLKAGYTDCHMLLGKLVCILGNS